MINENSEGEEIILAIKMLVGFFCPPFKSQHAEYVGPALNIIGGVLLSSGNEEVQKIASHSFATVVSILGESEYAEKEDLLKLIHNKWLEKLYNALIAEEMGLETLRCYGIVLTEILRRAGKWLTDDQLEKVVQVTLDAFNKSRQRMLKNNENNEEDEEEDENENESQLEEELQSILAKLFESLFKTYKEKIMYLVITINKDIFPKTLEDNATPSEVKAALALLANIIEYFGVDLVLMSFQCT